MSKLPEAIVKLLENITISAWVLDGCQNIVFMNRFMQDLFGDLTGSNASLIYECTSFEAVGTARADSGGFTEMIIADVPFRRLNCDLDLGPEGRFNVEFFEDKSEEKLIRNNMAVALAKISAETKMAKTIQKSILPVDDTYWNTIAFNSLYMPADDLGGDFYDVVKLNDDEFLIYIADVSGHGIQASLLTIFMSERVRANSESALAGTGVLLSKLVHDFSALDIDNALYITMVICKYSKSRQELSISNAGHNCFPLIIRNNGRTETIPTRGIPVCMLAEGEYYDEETVGMKPGDRLVLFTDGIIEEVDNTTGRSFGAEGVRRLAVEYHAFDGSFLASKIIEESARYALISAKDDRTILVADILS